MKKIFKLFSISLILISCGSIKKTNIKYDIFNSWELEEILIDGISTNEFQENESIVLKIFKTNSDKKADYKIKAFINNYKGSIDIIDNQNINVNIGMGTKAMDTKMERLFINQFLNEIFYSIEGNKLTLENKSSKIKIILSYKQE